MACSCPLPPAKFLANATYMYAKKTHKTNLHVRQLGLLLATTTDPNALTDGDDEMEPEPDPYQQY